MTLWINGDWVTGEGEERVKTNPVGKEVLWKGHDASIGQVEQVMPDLSTTRSYRYHQDIDGRLADPAYTGDEVRT